MLVSDYNYELPEERIAKFPPEKRGATRLLVLNRENGEIMDSHYRDLADFLNPGDVLVLNDTKVMPSRIFATLPDGRKRELVVLENHHGTISKVMYRGKLRVGDVLTVVATGTKEMDATAKDNGSEATGKSILLNENEPVQPQIKIKRLLGNGLAEVESAESLAEIAEKYGEVPLPPYLHREATPSDKERYQTVWAKQAGSAAAPTASLNMTAELLEKLRQKGVKICYLTLHVGLGTFLPMRTDNVEDHHMHSEWFEIPEETVKIIQEIKCDFLSRTSGPANQKTTETETGSNKTTEKTSCKIAGTKTTEKISRQITASATTEKTPRRIVAVGTTVARTLEFYAKTGLTSGEDDIFIYPGFQFQIVDALLTNFHAPKSTVLMLAAAFAGWNNLHQAYQHAIKEQYDFLSYGDSMLILSHPAEIENSRNAAENQTEV